MNLLILGGSRDHPGGVEAFCERSAEALERRGGWRIAHIATSTAYLSIRRLPTFLRGIGRLVRARRNKQDCVWLQYGNLPDLAYFIVAKALGMRVMVTPHLGSNWRSQSTPPLRWVSGWTLRSADRLALISHTQEQEINLPPDVPRSLIRNFLPAEILGAQLPDETAALPVLQLIHSGRLSEGKGSFLVIEMCARLRDAGVPFCARITGGAEAATYDRLRAMIAKYRLEDHVSLLGRVSEQDLLDYLRMSDVLIHLSKIDSYPLIVLEAMACSMLAVCMELAGARDMVETYGGHVVSQADAVDETVAWLAAQDLADLRRRGRIAAAQVRADYDWNRCATALDVALRACVAGDTKVVTGPEPVR